MRQRIQSVDFLRGFTILLMVLVNTPGSWSSVYNPFLHAEWEGLTLADLVFPFFLFIVGISISIAYKKKTTSSLTYKKIMVRTLKLFLLGIFLNGFLPYFPFFQNLADLRIPGVLQRIAIVFCITSILYLNVKKRNLIYISIGLLVGYWILLAFIPLPNGMAPSLARDPQNWANYIDVLLLKGHTYKPDYDPEGILSTIPSIVSALLGVFIGELLLSKKPNTIITLLLSAVLLLACGYAWNIAFPINKALWSSSFVLVTAGYAILILAVAYYVLDYKKIKTGGVFKMVGANAIIIYFLSMLLSKIFGMVTLPSGVSIHQWLYETIFVHEVISLKTSSLLYALAIVAFYAALGVFLYKRKIFIKV